MECAQAHEHTRDGGWSDENACGEGALGTGRVGEQTGLVEGQTVIVVVPEHQDVHFHAEVITLLVRFDGFRNEVGPISYATRNLVRQGRRNGQ